MSSTKPEEEAHGFVVALVKGIGYVFFEMDSSYKIVAVFGTMLHRKY